MATQAELVKIDDPELLHDWHDFQQQPSKEALNHLFLHLLTATALLVPMPRDQSDGKRSLQYAVAKDDSLYISVFTSLAALNAAMTVAPADVAVLNFDQVLKLYFADELGKGLNINPSTANIPVMKNDLWFMARRRFAMTNSQPQFILAEGEAGETQPLAPDSAVGAALATLFTSEADVHRAWLVSLTRGNGAVDALVIIDFDGDATPLFEQTRAVATPALPAGQALDIAYFDAMTPFLQQAMAGDPFYDEAKPQPAKQPGLFKRLFGRAHH